MIPLRPSFEGHWSKIKPTLFLAIKKPSQPYLANGLPDLVQTATQIATFKAGEKRKTTHQHLLLPKSYSGEPVASVYTSWTKPEAKAYLTSGWGSGAITDLALEYLYRPDTDEVSGEWDR